MKEKTIAGIIALLLYGFAIVGIINFLRWLI
jgi:hypothetical protein